MITITSAIEEIIGSSPFLDEALSEGLINVSSLARSIKPEVERLTKKEVKESAIIMAIHRRPAGHVFLITKRIKTFMAGLGDIIVRSGLSDHTFENSPTLNSCLRQLMKSTTKEKEVFCTFSQGVKETTVIASNLLDADIEEMFKNENLLARKKGLGSVTVLLPKNNTEVSGVYYTMLKHLAWANINICEIISTTNEISLIFSEKDVAQAFPILMNLKRKW
ncbi:MAG TPA: hypothetical protein VLH37_06560 [Bacteroidales bacterium]|nr:hypothetical protein [Bacteroidales bacterium]